MKLVYRQFSSVAGVLIRTKYGAWAGINTKLPLGRKRFTIAHELGHFLLHEGCHTDSLNQAQPSSIEQEANRFAGELLMPERLLRRSISQFNSLGLNSIDITKELAWAYKTSSQSMSIQLKKLNLLA